VDAHQQSEKQRFEVLFRQHYGAVRAYVRRRGAPDSVDDVVGETFLVAWRRLDDVPFDALPWLIGVARRVLSTERRSVGRKAALLERLRHEHAPAPSAGPVESPSVVASALARLSNADRELIALIAWDGLTPAQAASVVGGSAVRARVRLHRAKRRLLKELGREEQQPDSIPVVSRAHQPSLD